jgi:hypothetical protein
MKTHIRVSLAVFVWAVLLPVVAAAQEAAEPAPPAAAQASRRPALPVRLAERPLTLPKGTLRVDTDIHIERVALTIADPFTGISETFGETFVSWRSGAGFGISDDFEAGAQVLPLLFSPDFEFLDLVLYGMYRFHSTDSLQVAARAELVLPTYSDTALALNMPVLYRASANLRIDTGVQLFFRFGDASTIGLGAPLSSFYAQPLPTRSLAGIPFILNYNLSDNLFLGARSGLSVMDFEAFGDSIAVPLGAQAGYSIALEGTGILDVTARFEFPWFINSVGGDAVNTDLWQLTFAGNFYLDVM